MVFIDWTEKDKINIKSIDEQHLAIINNINKMHELMISNDKELKLEIIDAFVHSLVKHFNDEEKLMKENNFANFFSHRLEHERMREKANRFRKAFLANETDINLEYLNSLKKWFFNHNELNDIKMGKYLSSIGIE